MKHENAIWEAIEAGYRAFSYEAGPFTEILDFMLEIKQLGFSYNTLPDINRVSIYTTDWRDDDYQVHIKNISNIRPYILRPNIILSAEKGSQFLCYGFDIMLFKKIKKLDNGWTIYEA